LLWQRQRSFNKAGASRPQQGQALDRQTLARLPPTVAGVRHKFMNCISELFLEISSDAWAFFGLQALVVIAFFIALINEAAARSRVGKGGTTLRVGRGNLSMAIFYGVFAAINGLLASITLEVNVIPDHRTFWVIFDALITFYLCALNPWSRNKLLEWADNLTKLEQR
jgi:hypothetical protein